MVALCTLTIEGRLRDCKLKETLPGMQDEFLYILAERRYAPAFWDDAPLEVPFNVGLNLHLPER